MNQLHPVPIEQDLVISLTNLELINQIYALHAELRKLNESLDTANRVFAETRRSFIEGHIDHSTYAANINNFKSSMEDLRKFSRAAMKDITSAFAATRVLLKDDDPLSRLIRVFLSKSYTESQRKKIPEEIQKLEGEISKISEESRVRISAIDEETY